MAKRVKTRYRTVYEPAPTIDVSGLWFKVGVPLIALIGLVLTIYSRFDNPQKELETRFQLLDQKVETLERSSVSDLTEIRASVLQNSTKDEGLRQEVVDLNRKIDQILYALEYNTKPSNAQIPSYLEL